MTVLQNIRDRMAEAVKIGKRDPESGHSLGDAYLVAALLHVAEMLSAEDADAISLIVRDYQGMTRRCA